MGFWRSLKNFIDNQIEASRERRIAEAQENDRLRSIRREGEAYGYGVEAGTRRAKSDYYAQRSYERRINRPFNDHSWDVNVPTSRETQDIWFGSNRKKKRKNDSFW